ncbi:hypothetical protein [Parvicella tangerina]|uniref:DUF3575 domain-containing protein n=1 Tax=Parvicella tangerina TaxID=2829795 RepID=A0A916JIR0_9FLAO|nr:hypothetical protein [Parvicella tangerina]CAG5076397.1 hypothetical protein CRYO30217_00097 [Parvicella tangerina]
MKSIRIFGAMLLTIAISLPINAQDLDPLEVNSSTYKTAVGLRGGETSGLTIKHFMNEEMAIEGILGAWNRGFSATVLVERHQRAFSVKGLNWYYGVGGHASLLTNGYVWYRNGRRYAVYENDNYALGIDGIAGLEYKIPKAPFAVSLDLKPYMEIISNGNVWLSVDPGLGIKLTF